MIEKESTAVLVIDAQLCAFDGVRSEACFESKELLEKLVILIMGARKNKVPIVFIQHCGFPGQLYEEGTDQWIIHPEISAIAGEVIVQKRQSNSFDGTVLEDILNNDLGVKNVIVCGLQSEFCVTNTCIAAMELGFGAIVASDAHSTWSNEEDEAQEIIARQNFILKAKGAICQPVKEIFA